MKIIAAFDWMLDSQIMPGGCNRIDFDFLCDLISRKEKVKKFVEILTFCMLPWQASPQLLAHLSVDIVELLYLKLEYSKYYYNANYKKHFLWHITPSLYVSENAHEGWITEWILAFWYWGHSLIPCNSGTTAPPKKAKLGITNGCLLCLC